jgi:hypothetical protein
MLFEITAAGGSLILIFSKEPELMIIWFWNIWKTETNSSLKIQITAQSLGTYGQVDKSHKEVGREHMWLVIM